jgi:Tol biopolymer transport system component
VSGDTSGITLGRTLAAGALVAALLIQPSAAAPAPSVRTLAAARVPITAFAQDGRRIAWLQPRTRRRVALRDLVSRRSVLLPAKKFESDLGAPPDVLPSIALGGNRVVYVLYEQQGNTEEHFFVVTTGVRDRAERLLASVTTNDCPCPGSLPSWRLAADGGTVVFAIGQRLYRLAGSRAVRIAGTAGTIAVSRNLYASASLRSQGGCVCNLDPSWSPDGSLAYTAGQPLSPDETAQTRIRIVSARGGQGGAIAAGSQPAWSPDGSLIAYVRRTTDSPAIYLIRPDGSGARRLVAGSEPAWHPDGQSLALVRPDGRIYVAALNGGNVRRVLDGDSPAWSPDGRRLAFARSREIWVANADGSGATRLTQHAADAETSAGGPAWSPDGRRLAYTVYRVPQDTGEIADARVWVMGADGSEKRQLAVGRSATPAWSRDGARIAYAALLATRHPARWEPRTEIFAAAPDGTQATRVTTTSVAEPTTIGYVRRFGRARQAASLKAEGALLDLALTPRFAALLVERMAGKRIVLLHPRTGRLLRKLDVPLEAFRISAAGRYVVYSLGKEIMALRTDVGRTRTVAVAATAPRQLSIEGRRVAWIENRNRRGFIRAVTLTR